MPATARACKGADDDADGALLVGVIVYEVDLDEGSVSMPTLVIRAKGNESSIARSGGAPLRGMSSFQV